MSNKDLWIIQNSLGFGGTETFSIELYYYLKKRRIFNQINFLVFSKINCRLNDSEVCIEDLTEDSKTVKLHRIYDIIKKNKNIVFVLGADIILKLNFFLLKKNVFVFERTDPFNYPEERWKKSLRNKILKLKGTRTVMQSELIKNRLGLHKSQVLHKNIYLEDFQFRFSGATLKILVIARFTSEKNHLELIKILSKYKGQKINICFLGDGPTRAECEEKSRFLPKNITVCFPGNVIDVERFIQNCDVGILPSKYEGVPNSVLEMWNYQKPVIFSSNLLGIQDYLSDYPFILSNWENLPILIEKIFNKNKYQVNFTNFNFDEEINRILHLDRILN